MNKLLAGFAALAIGTLASQAAVAQAWYGHRSPPPSYGYGYAPRPVMYPHPYAPPAYGYRSFRQAPPRCFTRMDSVWNGWRWAQRPVRI